MDRRCCSEATRHDSIVAVGHSNEKGEGASASSLRSFRDDANSSSRGASHSTGVLVAVPCRPCTCLACRPDLYLQTIHASELQAFERTRTQLRLFQHECLHISNLAIESFNDHSHRSDRDHGSGRAKQTPPAQASGSLSLAQHQAIQKWREWLTGPEVSEWTKALDLRQFEPQKILSTAMDIFNQLFFLGQLPVSRARCGDGVITIRWSPPGTRRRACSDTIWRSDDLPTLTVIWINPYHASHFLNSREVVNTLLHELCHAFLQRFSCYMGGAYGCDRNQVCVELCQDNYGATGHGRAWQRLAAAIEEAAPRLLEGWHVDLGRCESAVREVETVGMGWWPSACDLRGMGKESWWKFRSLMRARDDDRMVVQRVRSWVLKGRQCPRRQRLGVNENSARETQPNHGQMFNQKRYGRRCSI